MPVKNTGAFLNVCLDSILAQNFTAWELIAVDDHSTDDSYKILLDYAQKDARIKAFQNIGNGIITALRLAYHHSKTQFITRMDSDDSMEPNKLALLHSQLQSKGEGYLAVGLINYFCNPKLGEGYQAYAAWLNKLTYTESNFSDIYKECAIPSPCWMIRRKDFDNCGGFASDVYPEDYDLAFRFRKAGLKITSVKQVIHQWRDYQARTSRTDKNYRDNRFSKLKVMHFLDQDRDINLPLVVWGAGNKGKNIARLLAGAKVDFQWVCNNPNKIGKDIYGTYLQELSMINEWPKAQVIVAVSSPQDAREIELLISNNKRHQYIRFF